VGTNRNRPSGRGLPVCDRAVPIGDGCSHPAQVVTSHAPAASSSPMELVPDPPVGMSPGHGTLNPGDSFPKVALPGSLHQERKQCGTPGCRCAQGRLHGPYWVRRWREDGRLRRAYVPRDQVAQVRAAITEWRRLYPVPWSVRQALAELRRLEQEIRPCPP
jgi:hypothetical protein